MWAERESGHVTPASGGSRPRIWLITGANSGLGAAFARATLNAGDTVAAAEHPDRVTVVALEVREPDQCRRAVETALAAHGRIDVLVNNAGYGIVGEVEPLGIQVLIVEPGAFRTNFAGPALRTSTPLSDYAATSGASLAGLHATHGRQPGDPAKAADAVLTVLGWTSPPLRLALGDDATTAIRAKLAAIAEDLDRTTTLSQDTTISA